jgi:hypothetical protein
MTVGSEVNGQLLKMSADTDKTLEHSNNIIAKAKAIELGTKANS